jgi:Amiloride-sensitive sodium channel
MCPNRYYLDEISNFTNCNTCLKLLREIAIPLKDIFIKCKFRNREINCTESFIETLVENRFCYTFNELGVYRQLKANSKNVEEWTTDDGYKQTASIDAYPYRALAAGSKFGFSILLRSIRNQLDHFCSVAHGFSVNY